MAVAASAEPPQASAPPDVVFGTHAGIMAMRTSTTDSPITEAPSARLAYYGGRVISNVKVFAINWGPNVNATVKAQIGDFYKAVTSSAHMDWLAEYNTAGKLATDGSPGSNQRIGRGTFGASITITPRTASTSITDSQIQSELAAQIAAGTIPAPELDAGGNVNSIYMFDFPPGMSITGPGGVGTSCVQFCAYHGTIVIGGKSVPYGVHPDLGGACAGGCGKDPVLFNNVTSVHSHELVEAITDVEVGIGAAVGRPLAWYDPTPANGEIGDICNALQATVAGYTVQTEWSNLSNACVATRTLPICNGTTDVCAQCTAADDGKACSGATPFCATDAADPKRGQCVACTKSAECGGATPVCDKSAGATEDTCRACKANADCGSDAPVCELSGAKAGTCVICVATSDCKKGTCDTTTNTCAECETNAQCGTDKPVCTSRVCVGCKTDSQCSGGNTCDVGVGACVPRGAPHHDPDGGVIQQPSGGGNGFHFSPPNTNASCAMSDGGGSTTVGGGLLAGLLFAAVAGVRRSQRRRQERE